MKKLMKCCIYSTCKLFAIPPGDTAFILKKHNHLVLKRIIHIDCVAAPALAARLRRESAVSVQNYEPRRPMTLEKGFSRPFSLWKTVQKNKLLLRVNGDEGLRCRN